MDFGQKWMLWGLLLGLLPIFIHLFNRLRHRKLPWAAMMFLRMANRKSTRYAKLRQWLVLIFRVLVVLALIFALSKPLVGGSFTKWFSGKPDVIVVVLDRSASMGAGPDAQNTLLKDAVDRIVKELKDGNYDGTRLVLLEHTGSRPQEVVGGVSALENLASTAVTDTAADLPTLLESASTWFEESQPGKGEVWVATDLQASNWNPAEKLRWQRLTEKLGDLPQSVSVRLLAMDAEAKGNVSVAVENVVRHGEGDRARVNLTIKLTSDTLIDKDVGVAVYIHGKGEEKCDVGRVEGASHVFDNDFALPKTETAQWGYVELVDAEDGNARDNRAYFVYGEPTINTVAVVGDASRFTTRFFELASAPNPENKFVTSQILDPKKLNGVKWQDYEMVVWQGRMPSGDTADKLTEFAEAGGVVVCFADDGASGDPFHGVQWGNLQQAQVKNENFATWQELVEAETETDHFGFVIDSYTSDEGPFKRTQEGLYIPVTELRINKFRPVVHKEGTILANLSTGETVALRRNVGKGQVVFMATRPTDDWSSLTEGLVVVPMLERLLVEGEAARSGRFINLTMWAAGDDRAGKGENWESVDVEQGQTRKDVNTEAGVYRMGKRLVAVNRPAREDDLAPLDEPRVRGLFGAVPLTMRQVKSGEAPDEKRAIWKLFLALMVIALLVEGMLILPKGADEGVEIQRSTTGKVESPQAT